MHACTHMHTHTHTHACMRESECGMPTYMYTHTCIHIYIRTCKAATGHLTVIGHTCKTVTATHSNEYACIYTVWHSMMWWQVDGLHPDCVLHHWSFYMRAQKLQGQHAFSSIGPSVWNNLPFSVWHAQTVSSLSRTHNTSNCLQPASVCVCVAQCVCVCVCVCQCVCVSVCACVRTHWCIYIYICLWGGGDVWWQICVCGVEQWNSPPVCRPLTFLASCTTRWVRCLEYCCRWCFTRHCGMLQRLPVHCPLRVNAM